MHPCPRCGRPTLGSICRTCIGALGGSAQGAANPPDTKVGKEPVRSGFLVALMGALVLGTWCIALFKANSQFKAESDLLDRQNAAAVAAHQQNLDREAQERRELADASEAEHQMRLADKDLISGRSAQLAHNKEWSRRLAHDPSLANSQLEATQLQMARIGADSSIAAQDALKQVAQMASPLGSRVDVQPTGPGFSVRVAFKLAALTRDEAGTMTKHHTVAALRREVEALSAGVMKQLFDYCGSRGIERLSVSCNRTVLESPIPLGVSEAEREALLKGAETVLRSVYRISIRSDSAHAVSNWRAASEWQVLRLATVEKDGLRDITISSDAMRSLRDADMPPEF